MVDDDVGSLFREIVDDCQALRAALTEQCIHDEVDGPHFTWGLRQCQRFTFDCHPVPTTTPNRKPCFSVQPVYALVIDMHALSLKQRMLWRR